MAQENLEFIEITNVEELPVNERMFIEYNGEPIVILNLDGSLFAIGDVCTHDGSPLGDGEVLGTEIICPRHGARFDLRSGKATRAPAFQDIPTYPVKIEKGKILLGIKK